LKNAVDLGGLNTSHQRPAINTMSSHEMTPFGVHALGSLAVTGTTGRLDKQERSRISSAALEETGIDTRLLAAPPSAVEEVNLPQALAAVLVHIAIGTGHVLVRIFQHVHDCGRLGEFVDLLAIDYYLFSGSGIDRTDAIRVTPLVVKIPTGRIGEVLGGVAGQDRIGLL